jgi:hypothetical protein
MTSFEGINSLTSASSPAENDNRTHTRRSVRDKRFEFALFLTVLLRCLGSSQQTSVERQARLVVLACIRGPSFYPLEDAIEYQLRRLVDGRTWDKAKWYTQYYLDNKRERQSKLYFTRSPFIQFVLPTKVNRDCLELGATSVEQI